MSTELMSVDEFMPLLDKSIDRELIQGRMREWPQRFPHPGACHDFGNILLSAGMLGGDTAPAASERSWLRRRLPRPPKS